VPYMQQLKQSKSIHQNEAEFEKWLQSKVNSRSSMFRVQSAGAAPYKIPVVVHVIHNGETVGTGVNISDEQILSQITVLNNDFKRMNADKVNTPAAFQSVAGSLDIEFILAKRTPEGLPTNGIVRKNGGRSSWTSTRDDNNNNIEDFKELSYWPSTDYLNIWVLNITDYLGYAQFPISNLEGLPGQSDDVAETDGVVVAYDVFGTDDAGSFQLDSRYNKGRTLTHEVGHFFGLRHIWGDNSNCTATDYVDDTPTQGNSTNNACPSGVRTDACTPSAPGIMYQNYMDYTNDACMNLFTAGQVNRMIIILEDASVPRRRSLWETSQGLVDPVCGPTPPVDVVITQLVQPGLITCSPAPEFMLEVQNMSCPTITSIKIDFTINGINQSKTFTNLSILPTQYAILNLGKVTIPEGQQNVSFSVALVNGEMDSDPTNSDTVITIARNSARDIIPLREDFNNNNLNSWTAVNPQNGFIWDVEGISQQYSARFPIQLNNEPNAVSWLASPVLNLKSLKEASLFFDLNYTWDGVSNDGLKIIQSTDCGNTYTSTDFNFIGEQLQTQSQARYFIDITDLTGFSDVRIAFVATSASGKNIYIDNIEFFIGSDPDPLQISDLFAIYRISATETSITFNLPDRYNVGFSVIDIMGRLVVEAQFPNTLNQTYTLESTIPTGMYIIRLQIGNRYFSTKVYFTQ
jgi:hypothetical protein